MPKRSDIRKILVIGSGPIVIGQAAEFDYSGTQACQALREEGYEVVLVNSNPATIMTDPQTAEAVYIEPLDVDVLTRILRKERPQGIIGTMGGQTALNLLQELHFRGVLKEIGCRILGTPIEAVIQGEDRDKFKELMQTIGEPVAASIAATSVSQALDFAQLHGYPLIVRPAYTLGGTGGGIARSRQELELLMHSGLHHSMISQVLVEKAALGRQGWGEFEFEVMRDNNDTCIIICPMENVDPMGFHTGESIVVAPTQTLSDEDFQKLRNSALHVIRALKIEGGCNIQFAFNYHTGEYFIIEVNPRVSRSSALASKATGYPIARIAAKIAIGMRLDEIPNDITGETPACFEPTIDYCVVKIPRWPFDKFRSVDKQLGTQMKSTGETMALGRTFEEALQKAVRSLEVGRYGLGYDGRKVVCDLSNIRERLVHATDERLFSLFDAFSCGLELEEVYSLTGINRWFLTRIENIYRFGLTARFERESIVEGKRLGFCDKQLGCLFGVSEDEIRAFRKREDIVPCFKMVDTCAGEFAAKTPYFYSTYEDENEAQPTNDKKVIILGSGPIRIGQGIEFDYSCIHGVFALREAGYEAIIINNNPETVSTDFDISDRLYFEPLTFEDVMNVIDNEQPEGVIVQFGGQTAINLALRLEQAGVRILGTSPAAIDLAEDREKFGDLLGKVGIPSPAFGLARSLDEARAVASRIGYPVLVRPSYVLGGRAMEIVSREEKLVSYMKEAVRVSEQRPVLIDRFLGNAIELDVDVLCDGSDVLVAAIMEHIEHAGVHSGDSSCVIPPQSISDEVKEKVISYSTKLARELCVVGLLNIQYAVKDNEVFILEANPRASRTVPYVSKTIGVALANVATKLMLGERLSSFALGAYREPSYCSVKSPVFPFPKLAGLDPLLSPEMKSTGEVMGIDQDFGRAYYKAQLAAGQVLREKGNVFVSVGREEDKSALLSAVRDLVNFGYMIYATQGTADFLTMQGVLCIRVPKIRDSPKVLEMMRQKELALTVLIARGGKLGSDGYKMRRAAVEMGIPYVSTVEGARAVVRAIEAKRTGELSFRSMQEYHRFESS